MAAPTTEDRHQLLQGQLATPARAEFLIGGDGHDPVEPGAEGRLTSEAVDLSDHGPERVLHDFLRILSVPRDTRGQAIRAVPVRGDETLRCRRLAPPERFQKVEIPVCTPRMSDGRRLGFESHLKSHLSILRAADYVSAEPSGPCPAAHHR